jgi:hypothetical protein
MNDLRTEADVRAALDLLAQDAPDVADLLRPLAAGKQRSRAHRLVPLAAALVVVLVVAGIAALYLAGRQSAQPDVAAIYPDLPQGMRPASYGQVSVHVPSDLPTRTSLCGGPVSHEVVWFSARNQGSPYASISTSPARVDGQPARRGYATGHPGLGLGVSGVVTLPSQAITVGVTAPTRKQVDAVLSSIRVASRDLLGCAATIQAASTTSAGPSNVLVPAEPVFAVRCVYSTAATIQGLLIGSFDLGPSATHRLTAALNELSPDPCHCVHGGTAAPGRAEVLYFHYRDQSTLRITGALGANLDSYSNGKREVANYEGSIGQMLTRLSNGR